MAARKFTMVCKDCGEVVHLDLTTLKAGSLVACAACGLVSNPQHLRLPAPPAPPTVGQPAPPPARGTRPRVPGRLKR